MTESKDLARIIVGCKRADAESFSQLIDMYSRRCYGYFYRLTGNRDVSDDLLSELFVRLVEKISSFKGGSFDGWLFRTASNIFHDYLRDKYRRRRLIEGQKERLELRPGKKERDDNENVDKLQIQLGKMDEDTRKLLMLRFYSQLSFKELAEQRGEPIGTTLSKVHRGLKKLRELMEQ